MTQGAAKEFRSDCGKCGAVRQDYQIGLESSLDAYIAELVTVFREVRRILRDDGSLWLVLGDSYASAWPCSRRSIIGSGSLPNGKREARPPRLPGGLKEKDLMMVPARVAIALCDDGWYLRSDIIWAKKAPMPESVTDRPTSAHEHVFLLTKKPRYFYDAEAVKEPASEPAPRWGWDERKARGEPMRRGLEPTAMQISGGVGGDGASRNLRNVWHLGPEPFPASHFAVFPTKLVEPCIKAGTSEKGCCAACGAPWTRVTERTTAAADYNGSRFDSGKTALHQNGRMQAGGRFISTAIGWHPSCHCNAGEPVPCTVLDPFGGAGTVGLVADRLGRNSILIELNEQYAKMANQRLIGDCPMFAEVTA